MPRWQFKLQHLFGLTTIAAIGAALLARWGWGTLLTSAGFLIAWLNLCGAFAGFQKEPRQIILLCLAWGMFLLSLALPSLTIFGPVYGYGAAWIAMMAPLDAVKDEAFHRHMFWYLTVDVANLSAALLPLLIWRLRCGRGRWSAMVHCVSLVATPFPFWDTPMLVGYYVWCASFLLALIAIPIGPRTFAAMLCMAVVMFFVLKVN